MFSVVGMRLEGVLRLFVCGCVEFGGFELLCTCVCIVVALRVWLGCRLLVRFVCAVLLWFCMVDVVLLRFMWFKVLYDLVSWLCFNSVGIIFFLFVVNLLCG